MANYNYSFTFFVCFCFGLLILFVDFVILLYLILICHSYCFRLFVSFPFGWCINSVSGIVFLFSGCGFVLFSLLDYRFGSRVSVLGLRFSVSLFCFYRPQYKLNRYSVASKLQTTEDNFTRQPYRDEATALVWIECLVLIGAQNITSFNLEQTINERINLSKTEKGGKKCLAPLVVSDLRSSERSFYHYTSIRSHTLFYMQVHDVFRNYLARMRAFHGSRSLLTVENRSQLIVIFFDWSDKNCCSISYEKWGKTDNLLVT